MNNITMTSLARLEHLPSELIEHILGLLPDVTSLLSSILSCSSLYSVFSKVEILITSKVVERSISEEVLPEAVATWKSSLLGLRRDVLLQDFADDQLRSRQHSKPSWTLSEALPLAGLHRHVEYFSTDFALQTLAGLGEDYTYNTALTESPSSDELHRIQRAFYRFEIYCNLSRSRQPDPFVLDEQPLMVFFSKFSPWENEQLGCIHDYLFHKVSPGKRVRDLVSCKALTVTAFNEITDHDVTWGASGVIDAFDIENDQMQYILSLGLARLHDIVVAKSYDERHHVLYTPHPASTSRFLYDGLQRTQDLYKDDALSWNDLDNAEGIASLHPPFKHESDTGPIDAWGWAYNPTDADFVYAESHEWLRLRGYVFWDHSRLDAWSIFQSPYGPPDTTVADAERASYAASDRLWDDTRGRCNRRAEIHRAGGRGWWSLEDESKVVYPPGQSPPPYPNRGVGKTSQQGADELQRKFAQSNDGSEARPSWQTWKPRVPMNREERRGRQTQPWGS